jgi:glycosyltransferase involved in cell wall biosynthesis
MLFLSRITGKPFVEWVHTDNYVRSVGSQWNDARLEGRQWTVFNSKSLRASRKDLPDATTKIILPIVDYRDYAVDKEKKTPKYVTLSNVNDNKGGNLLVQLAKALPDMEFQGIIGGYRKQIVHQGLPNLKYVQHTTRIKDVYANTWVQIMPSKEETWGRTAVEAMSSGIPLVVSPTPGLKECCGDAALYCDRADLDAWVVTLRKLKDDVGFYNTRSTIALERARTLDPLPEIKGLEKWLETTVQPSAQPGRLPTTIEKNLLFR